MMTDAAEVLKAINAIEAAVQAGHAVLLTASPIGCAVSVVEFPGVEGMPHNVLGSAKSRKEVGDGIVVNILRACSRAGVK